jgi:two-component system NtrC family sensor kinase
VSRRTADASAPLSPSASILETVAELADRLGRAEPLDDRIDAAVELLRGTLGLAGCLVRVRLAGGAVHGAARGAVPDESDAGGRRAACLTIPLADGGQFSGALVVAPPPRDADGRAMLAVAANLLVAMVRAEGRAEASAAEVDAQRRLIARVVDSLPVGLYVVDRDYRVQAWNRTRETGLQGVARQAALGRPIFEVLHRQPSEALRREFDAVFGDGVMRQYELETGSGAERRWYRVTKIPMRLDDEDITHVIAIGEDLTERRRDQERAAQAEKLAAVGQLAAGVMHEVNNPLAVIGACAESIALRLEQEDAAPAVRESLADYVRIIDHEVQRCTRIVTGLLDFSRPSTAGRTRIDLDQLVEETLFLLQHHARVKQMRVEQQRAERPVRVTAAREQLIQVVMALLLNAADASEPGGRIVVRADRRDPEWVSLEVGDEGCGIAPADQSRLFDPFFTTKPPGRGTGLGLSICYGIVTEHGGRIEVVSEPGRGSTFRVVLPSSEDS